MALSSALFAGSSGLSALGDTMQIIGDNIANVNTIGFKSSRANFQDLLSQAMSTMNGSTQVGSGSTIGNVSQSFAQGSFESTGNSTDMAIGGEGFFILKDPISGVDAYSRAGSFAFNKDGDLANPNGYIVQGWKLDEASGNDTGSIKDIHLDSFTSKPKESSEIQIIANLDSRSVSNSADLSAAWQTGVAANDDPPLSDDQYEYQTTVQVYDSLGSPHDITLYFDKNASSDSDYDCLVTCDPSEDKRTPAPTTLGLLGSGTISFDAASGVMTNIAMDGKTTSDLNDDGLYTISPDFLGSTATAGSSMEVALDFGSNFVGGTWKNDSLTTTQYSVESNTTYKKSDGYPAGELQDITVDEEGVMTGSYSNGQKLKLYRVALADFQNQDALSKLGGNLFGSTSTSGDAVTNKPGSNGLGSIAPGSLEQSNVDIADEFVRMITTQRGYQANSKIITTVDTMLSELMNLKR